MRLSLTEFAKGLNYAPEKLWGARSQCVQWIDFKEAPPSDLGVCLFVRRQKWARIRLLECCWFLSATCRDKCSANTPKASPARAKAALYSKYREIFSIFCWGSYCVPLVRNAACVKLWAKSVCARKRGDNKTASSALLLLKSSSGIANIQKAYFVAVRISFQTAQSKKLRTASFKTLNLYFDTFHCQLKNN